MSIILGSAVLNANTNAVTIAPPVGQFGGIKACRLSNYTGDALILTNMDGDDPGQQLLMPFQQNVYKTNNLKQPPTIQGVTLGQLFSVASVFVEWSTEPLDDFPGTYPTGLTQGALLDAAAPAFEVHTLAVPDDGTTYSIAADLRRISLTIINNGAVDLRYSAFDSGWTGRPKFEQGGGRTINTSQAVFFRVFTPGGGAGSLQWLMTRYGSPPVS